MCCEWLNYLIFTSTGLIKGSREPVISHNAFFSFAFESTWVCGNKWCSCSSTSNYHHDREDVFTHAETEIGISFIEQNTVPRGFPKINPLFASTIKAHKQLCTPLGLKTDGCTPYISVSVHCTRCLEKQYLHIWWQSARTSVTWNAVLISRTVHYGKSVQRRRTSPTAAW